MDDVPAVIRKTFEPLSLLAPSKDMRATENSEPAKQSKTTAEIGSVDPCGPAQRRRLPTKGSEGTVYGLPWKAMLMFGAEAGPVRNKDDLKKFFEFFTERLQRLYDIRFDDP
jgi:hypothetical protein